MVEILNTEKGVEVGHQQMIDQLRDKLKNKQDLKAVKNTCSGTEKHTILLH